MQHQRQSRPARSKVSAYHPIHLVLSSGKSGKVKAARAATLKRTKLPITLTCPKSDGNACTGTVAIRTTTKLGGHKVWLGRHHFSVRAGHSLKVTFTLKSDVAMAIHRAHTVRSTLTLKGSATASSSLTIEG